MLTLIWWRFYRRELQLAEVEKQLAADRARAAELERQAVDARLRALHAQVEPHFLYNTLASGQVLTRSDPSRANRMLGDLITYLRTSMPRTRTRRPPSARAGRAQAYLRSCASGWASAWACGSRCRSR